MKRQRKMTGPETVLPLFRKLADGRGAAELVAKCRAVDAGPRWPHGLDRFKRSVFSLLTSYGAPDLPWPSTEQLQAAIDTGWLPGDFAASLIRADGDEARAEFAEREGRSNG